VTLVSLVGGNRTLTETHQKLVVVDVKQFPAVFEAQSTEPDAIRELNSGET